MRDMYGIAEMLGATSLEDSASKPRDGDTITYYGTATSDSDSGTVSVHLSDDVTLADGDEGTSVELPCTCAVREGDTVMVTLVSAGNALRVPTVTGVVGEGDLTREIAEGAQETADKVVAHFWYDDEGAHVTETEHDATQGGNVLIDTDSVDIRDGEDVLAQFSAEGVYVQGVPVGDEHARLTLGTMMVEANGLGEFSGTNIYGGSDLLLNAGHDWPALEASIRIHKGEEHDGELGPLVDIRANNATVSWQDSTYADHTTYLTGQYLLYSGNASGDLTLSRTAADFEMIRVHYVCANAGHSSLDVFSPNGKNFTCVGTSMANSTTMQTEFAEYAVSGTTITKVNGGYFNTDGTYMALASDASAQAQIRITRVEGFEHWETTGLSAGSGGGSASYEAGTGIDITNNMISVDTAQLSYSDLQDKPSIEAHELVGDSSLDDISVHRLTNSEIDALMALADS